MPVKLICKCNAKFSARDELAGKSIECTACGRTLQVPELKAPGGGGGGASSAGLIASSTVLGLGVVACGVMLYTLSSDLKHKADKADLAAVSAQSGRTAEDLEKTSEALKVETGLRETLRENLRIETEKREGLAADLKAANTAATKLRDDVQDLEDEIDEVEDEARAARYLLATATADAKTALGTRITILETTIKPLKENLQRQISKLETAVDKRNGIVGQLDLAQKAIGKLEEREKEHNQTILDLKLKRSFDPTPLNERVTRLEQSLDGRINRVLNALVAQPPGNQTPGSQFLSLKSSNSQFSGLKFPGSTQQLPDIPPSWSRLGSTFPYVIAWDPATGDSRIQSGFDPSRRIKPKLLPASVPAAGATPRRLELVATRDASNNATGVARLDTTTGQVWFCDLTIPYKWQDCNFQKGPRTFAPSTPPVPWRINSTPSSITDQIELIAPDNQTRYSNAIGGVDLAQMIGAFTTLTGALGLAPGQQSTRLSFHRVLYEEK